MNQDCCTFCCDGESVDMFTNSFAEDVEIMYTHDGRAFIFILLSIVAQISVEGYSLFFVQCLHNNAVNLSCTWKPWKPYHVVLDGYTLLCPRFMDCAVLDDSILKETMQFRPYREVEIICHIACIQAQHPKWSFVL